MTNSAFDRGFRQLNIEQYDDEIFEDEFSESANAGPDSAQVQQLIMAGKASVRLLKIKAIKCN